MSIKALGMILLNYQVMMRSKSRVLKITTSAWLIAKMPTLIRLGEILKLNNIACKSIHHNV